MKGLRRITPKNTIANIVAFGGIWSIAAWMAGDPWFYGIIAGVAMTVVIAALQFTIDQLSLFEVEGDSR